MRAETIMTYTLGFDFGSGERASGLGRRQQRT